jgi:hypothetical protein
MEEYQLSDNLGGDMKLNKMHLGFGLLLAIGLTIGIKNKPSDAIPINAIPNNLYFPSGTWIHLDADNPIDGSSPSVLQVDATYRKENQYRAIWTKRIFRDLQGGNVKYLYTLTTVNCFTDKYRLYYNMTANGLDAMVGTFYGDADIDVIPNTEGEKIKNVVCAGL